MNKGFTQLKDLLPKAATKYGMSREVRAALICDRARKAVRDIWGADSREVRPLFYKDHILTVETDNSAVAQDVFFKKSKIIESIGENDLKDIRIKVSG